MVARADNYQPKTQANVSQHLPTVLKQRVQNFITVAFNKATTGCHFHDVVIDSSKEIA